jgi:ribosome biogenesis protein Tsr3
MKGSSVNRRNALIGAVVWLAVACVLVVFGCWVHHRQALSTLSQWRPLPTIMLASNGRYYVAGKQVSLSQLEAMLRQSR